VKSSWYVGGLLLALSAAQLGAQNAAPGPWAQFRGPNGQGISTDRGLPTTWSPTENIVWKLPMPGGGGSSPIVVGEKIYITCYSGLSGDGRQGDPNGIKRHLLCLNRADGKQLWANEIPLRAPEQIRIREDHGWATNTPAADAQRVFAYFGRGGLYAFDHTGKQLWTTTLGEGLHEWGSAASPILYKNLVIVNAGVESERLVAVNRDTGKEVWSLGGIKESWNTPILVPVAGGKTELVVAVFGKVLGVDPDSGQQLWSCNTDIGWYMVPSIVAADGVVYVIGGRTGGSLAVRCGGRGEVTATHRIWTGRKGSNVSSPVYADGKLYWAHENLGVVYCFDAKTGQGIYEERLPGADQIYACAILGDGKIYYMTRTGKTFVLPAAPRFQVLATNELGDRSPFNSSPAVAGGRILIRSDKFLYCIGEK
jgi:outer membrane protein assembly factor BamB